MCSIFIFLWVTDEVRFDRFHKDADRIFRVMENYHINDEIYTYEALPVPLAEKLQTEFAEVEHADAPRFGLQNIHGIPKSRAAKRGSDFSVRKNSALSRRPLS
jgi:hypothetical protein